MTYIRALKSYRDRMLDRWIVKDTVYPVSEGRAVEICDCKEHWAERVVVMSVAELAAHDKEMQESPCTAVQTEKPAETVGKKESENDKPVAQKPKRTRKTTAQ